MTPAVPAPVTPDQLGALIRGALDVTTGQPRHFPHWPGHMLAEELGKVGPRLAELDAAADTVAAGGERLAALAELVAVHRSGLAELAEELASLVVGAYSHPSGQLDTVAGHFVKGTALLIEDLAEAAEVVRLVRVAATTPGAYAEPCEPAPRPQGAAPSLAYLPVGVFIDGPPSGLAPPAPPLPTRAALAAAVAARRQRAGRRLGYARYLRRTAGGACHGRAVTPRRPLPPARHRRRTDRRHLVGRCGRRGEEPAARPCAHGALLRGAMSGVGDTERTRAPADA